MDVPGYILLRRNRFLRKHGDLAAYLREDLQVKIRDYMHKYHVTSNKSR